MRDTIEGNAASARLSGGRDVLALSSYAHEELPVSWFGIALILLAFAFFALDLVVTNHGLPTVAAVVAFGLGILTLFEVTAVYSWVALMVLVALAVLLGVVLVSGSNEAIAARGRPATTGVEGMIGEVGDVVKTVRAEPPGWIFVHGERWRAVPAVAPEEAYEQEDYQQAIGVGHRVQVVGIRDGKAVVLPLGSTGFER
jgi:membrane-bound ClpP family serine protease